MAFAKHDRSTTISVVAMFALAIFVASFIFYIVASNQKFFDSKYSLYMFLPNVEGLIPGAFITLAGLKVGVVGEMEFTEQNGQSGIKVELKIDRDIADKITASSVALVKTMGILGDKYIDITLGDPAQRQLAAGDYITGDAGIDAHAVFADAAETVTELKEVLRNTATLTAAAEAGTGVVGKLFMDPASGKDFGSLMSDLRRTTGRISRGQGTLGKLVADSSLYVSLAHSSQNLQAVLDSVQSGKGTFGKLLNDPNFYPQLKAITAKTDSLLFLLQNEGTAAKLLRDRALYDNWVNLTRSLDSLSTDLKKHPGRYVKLELF